MDAQYWIQETSGLAWSRRTTVACAHDAVTCDPHGGCRSRARGVPPARRARAIRTVLKQFDQLRGSAGLSVTQLYFADLARQPLDAIEDELNRTLYLP